MGGNLEELKEDKVSGLEVSGPAETRGFDVEQEADRFFEKEKVSTYWGGSFKVFRAF